MTSSHAATAKAIRGDLKKLFPTTTFTVRARSFSGGDAVDVDWSDGPTYKMVNHAIGKYQMGEFDGMIDLYEYTNRRHDIPQVKYVQCHREISMNGFQEMLDYIRHRFGFNFTSRDDYPQIASTKAEDMAFRQSHGMWPDMFVHRYTQDMSFVCASCGGRLVLGDQYCAECGTKVEEE